MPESARDRMYREAREAEQVQQQAAPQQVSMQPQPQPQQQGFQPPAPVQTLSTQDLLRLQRPYNEYVLTEQVSGRQPMDINDWAVNMSQGR